MVLSLDYQKAVDQLISKYYKYAVIEICIYIVNTYAKQKHPGYKKNATPIRSSIANRYVRPKIWYQLRPRSHLSKIF